MTGVTLGFIPEPLSVPLSVHLAVAQNTGDRGRIAQIQADKNLHRGDRPHRAALRNAVRTSLPGQHVLLDGHLRLLADPGPGHERGCLPGRDRRRELHVQQSCQSALDNPGALYDPARNRHEAYRRRRLAKALSVDVSQIIKKMSLLDGICPEAAELLGDRQFSPDLVRAIRKMKPTRQVECVELMVAANNVSVAYAEALLGGDACSAACGGKEAAQS